MADTPTRPIRPARADRHRPHLQPVPADAPPAPALETPPPRPAAAPARVAPRPAPSRPAPAPAVHDQTRDALRRPAHLSDRCSGCGAPTRGRSQMVTELVDVGPVRALRVVACSACPDRRRRDVIV